ncbi:FAD-dependent oxidoreductase [Legionella bozemanae]|uniref:Dihydroorotate dehydrogenase electron transfer subunit n=1 Tax=Legionella bozemanae TaxID=447 RepID=A0A0W0RNE4_LEGBO|nr:FAD-dependent oxidoreductase [Legionella bozemanae]KTC72594.1 dihydroorotate dehydrogenase electron transfer subunit [Legionella bozemanae]STO34389.1 dihydroorotate dehydrogenase electron transfer subunit [Legionella bozemanae]
MFTRHEAILKNKKVHGESQVYSLEIKDISPKDCGNGQYVVIHGDKKPIYLAIASSKNESYLKISQVLKSGAKNILSESQVDSHLEVDAPCGNEFKPAGEKVLLICAGSAESVMRNMYNNLTSEGKEVSVIYSAKRLEDLPFPKLIVRLNNNKQHYITLTEEKGTQFKSDRITEHLKTKDLDPETSVFVCGPVGFENDAVNMLLDKSHPAQNIHISHWGKILPVDSNSLVHRGFKIKENPPTEKANANELPQIKIA